jgi:hypothetical protein
MDPTYRLIEGSPEKLARGSPLIEVLIRALIEASINCWRTEIGTYSTRHSHKTPLLLTVLYNTITHAQRDKRRTENLLLLSSLKKAARRTTHYYAPPYHSACVLGTVGTSTATLLYIIGDLLLVEERRGA